MDQRQHEGEQTATDSSTPVKKHLGANFVSPTPEKSDETLNIRCKKEPVKLPEKYRILSEFFDRMTTSLRLLNLRKGLPIFQNICRQVEKLTGRNFSYRHLAQIKFILPEAVQTDKILLHNKKTLNMEPDIKITLLFDVIQGHIEQSAYIALCRTFSSRLFKFVSTHSEGCEIPEAELPEPFNQREMKISVNSLPVDSSSETLENINEAELLNPSHLHPSFNRHFSHKDVIEDSAKTQLSSSLVLLTSNEETSLASCLDPLKHDKALQDTNGDTPMKLPLVHDVLSVETPDLSTPKRSGPSEENKLKSVVANNMFAKRSLDFSNADNEESAFLEEEKAENTSRCTSKKDGITQSGVKTDVCLSKLVDTILDIFKSASSHSITKSEFFHKILVNNFDFNESGEIEEQIEILENKVPEWISKKVAPSGDLLYSIYKGLDLNSITEKLV